MVAICYQQHLVVSLQGALILALPLGFLANTGLSTIDFTSSNDAFGFQNRLLRRASGVAADPWHKLEGSSLSITATDAVLTSSGRSGYASYKTEDKAGTVTFSFTVDRAGFSCINLTNLTKKNSYSIRLNGKKLYSETYSLPQMLAIADVVPGDIIEVEFSCKKNESGSISAIVAILDEEIFRQAYDVLNASTLDLTTFTSTLVEGNILCDRDGLLYTSIPQNGNWSVMVDGKEAEITLVGDAMISVPLTEGAHTVTFRYRNNAYEFGAKVSTLCALVFAAIAAICYIPKRKKGKFER